MAATVSNLVEFLLLEMEAEDSTAFADTLLASAKAQILAGKGSIGFMTSSSANGKSFTKAQGLTCLEVATACRRALAEHGTGTGGQFTIPNFGGIS